MPRVVRGREAKQSTIFLNPFYIYSAMGSLTLILYVLGWSAIYGPIDARLLFFLLGTIAISGSLGATLRARLHLVVPKAPSLDFSKVPNRVTLLILAGFLTQFAYVQDVPFLSNIVFHRGIEYGEYAGIPVFTVLLVTFSVFYATYLIDQACHSCGRRRYLLLAQFAAVQLMFLMMMNRGAILLCVVMGSLLWLSAVKINGRRIGIASVAAAAVMYGFGSLGNLRSGIYAFTDSSYIIQLSNLSANYPEQFPGQFLWTYMYTVSPLGNLNSVVRNVTPNFDFSALLLNMIPDFVTKRFFPEFDPSTQLTVPYFNVSTGFAGAWKFYGGVGLWVTFTVLALVWVVASRTARPMARVSLAIASGMAVFMFFDNALSYSAVSFALVYPIMGSLTHLPRSLYTAQHTDPAHRAFRSRSISSVKRGG